MGEVRNQPRAGYLSSIETIVYALKAVRGLVYLSQMVDDQRRCKRTSH